MSSCAGTGDRPAIGSGNRPVLPSEFRSVGTFAHQNFLTADESLAVTLDFRRRHPHLVQIGTGFWVGAICAHLPDAAASGWRFGGDRCVLGQDCYYSLAFRVPSHLPHHGLVKSNASESLDERRERHKVHLRANGVI